MEIEISEKIQNALAGIAAKEDCSIDDLVEEAIMSYWNITLDEINPEIIEEENFNIANDQKEAIVKALNIAKTAKEAARLLGRPEKFIYLKKKEFNIKCIRPGWSRKRIYFVKDE